MSTSRLSLLIAIVVVLISSALCVSQCNADQQTLNLKLRYQAESQTGSGRYHRLHKDAKWNATETAVIVCDVWDSHHSINAVRRVQEFAPRLNELLKKAREQGATIIHSPSDCMAAYEKHPARLRAIETKAAENLPDDIKSWCSLIPTEEKAVYPIDQSDGGEDDDPQEHARWVAKLEQDGRKPGTPWLAQNELIEIDAARDFISDRGEEVWNVLESRGIKNVILTGVHVNMCVLGRPFGLRQMTRAGKQVVLVRDMTDTMYNPARWPYVSHFTGTDLIISHIEKFVCPTITSDQILGGKSFRFKNDKRPHVAIVMAEREYETNVTLPKFAAEYLGKDFRVTLVYASEDDRDVIPGLEVLDEAQVALISVRRRTLAPEQLEIVRRFVAAGKPVIGIRTANHAFCLRNKPAPEGKSQWTEFDAEVFGGNYTNHYGNSLESIVSIAKNAKGHPLLKQIAEAEPFKQGGSLYKTSPLASGTKVLLSGVVEGEQAEPVAWTYKRKDGGQSFYTSLGQKKDFENPVFLQLLVNSLTWATERPAKAIAIPASRNRYSGQWALMTVPMTWELAAAGTLDGYNGPAWYRCSVRLPEDWISPHGISLGKVPADCKVWFNGNQANLVNGRYAFKKEWIDVDDANLVVLRLPEGTGDRGLTTPPEVKSGDERLELSGRWQFRIGDDQKWSSIPLPARYGTSTDIVFQP